MHEVDPAVYVETVVLGIAPEGLDDRLVEVTEATANVLRKAIEGVATTLRPDLDKIGASKATVKIGAKLAIKNGRITALISEISGEGTVEVSVEFVRDPAA